MADAGPRVLAARGPRAGTGVPAYRAARQRRPGTVFLGVSPTGARVAVKLLRADLAQDEEALERFVREVSTTQRVAPFCTAAVIDTGVDQHRPYIISEYIDGPDTGRRRGRRGTP